jgi:hypothetical protein
MMRRHLRRHLRTRLVGTVAVALVVGMGTATLAADDDEDTFEQTVIKGILSGLGVQVSRPDLDYRERSPLVIPPSRELPPPETTATIDNPAWPKDPDQQPAKTATGPAALFENGTERQRRIDDGRLTPGELAKGKKAGAGRVTSPQSIRDSTREPGSPVLPSELGYTGGLFQSLNPFGTFKTEEEGTFTGEPPRTNLTQPPTGYQTPSKQYGYGLGPVKNNAAANLPIIKDRAVGKE